jgi:hypothetical protein
VVFVWLPASEIVAITFSKTILSVDLELATIEGVKIGDSGISDTIVLIRVEVSPLVFFGSTILTNDPDEFHARVVKSKLEFRVRAIDRLNAGMLDLSNKVLVGFLGSNTAFGGFEEHIVDPETSINKDGTLGQSNKSGVTTRTRSIVTRKNIEFRNRAEFKVDFHLVVLESNKRKSKTRILVEPEARDESHTLGGMGLLGSLETIILEGDVSAITSIGGLVTNIGVDY